MDAKVAIAIITGVTVVTQIALTAAYRGYCKRSEKRWDKFYKSMLTTLEEKN